MEIIAEIGAHHNCDLNRAYHLIDLAKEAGADAVKFQMYKADRLVVKDGAAYWNETKTQHEVFATRDLFTYDQWQKIAKYCGDKNIEFLATPFDLIAVENLKNMNVKRYKIASGDITNHPLLRSVAQTNNDILLSTGASTYAEIAEAISFIKSIWKPACLGDSQRYARSPKLTIMHCTLNYPSSLEQANLNRIRQLKCRFPDVQLGLSHHVIDDQMGSLYMAAGMGVEVVEVHFTDDRALPGDDHAHSLDSIMLKNLVSALSCLLKPAEEVQACELAARKGARRSIVADGKIKKGEQLTENNLTCKRPGTGIPPSKWSSVIGCVATQDFLPDELISWEGIR